MLRIRPARLAFEKILITGAAGFIGSHTADFLLNRGDTVVILDNLNTYYDPEVKRENVRLWRRSRLEQSSIRARRLHGSEVLKDFRVQGDET